MTGIEVEEEQNAATLPTSTKCHVHNRRKHMGRYHMKDAKTFLYTVWNKNPTQNLYDLLTIFTSWLLIQKEVQSSKMWPIPQIHTNRHKQLEQYQGIKSHT